MAICRQEITSRRERLGLSKSAFSREADLNASTVSQIESGRLVPYPVQVQKIEETLRRLERAAGIACQEG